MFPIGEKENWTTCESLLPHAQKVIQYRNALEKYPLKFSVLLSKMARFDFEQGRYEVACSGFSTAFDMQRKVLGMEHNWTLACMHNLACTYQEEGRLEEAEKLQMQVLEIRKRVLGAEHPRTLASMNNLAHYWNKQDRHSEANALMEHVVDLQTKVLGANHPDTKYSASRLKVWLDA